MKQDQRLILEHIRQCEQCVVNVDFHEFIYTRTGRSEVEIARTKRLREKEKQEEEEHVDL